mmetsp:Transcript_29411/g.44444  ORF Transcript_29411/g.44444 Transcript_29411/m.44444 type:complete len:210 (+) Transcript_29411:316-945(+)
MGKAEVDDRCKPEFVNPGPSPIQGNEEDGASRAMLPFGGHRDRLRDLKESIPGAVSGFPDSAPVKGQRRNRQAADGRHDHVPRNLGRGERLRRHNEEPARHCHDLDDALHPPRLGAQGEHLASHPQHQEGAHHGRPRDTAEGRGHEEEGRDLPEDDEKGAQDHLSQQPELLCERATLFSHDDEVVKGLVDLADAADHHQESKRPTCQPP